jgi:mevalonate kinase
MKAFRAHGKLLISAEYMVLHGSKALAVPLQKGQVLQRIRSENRSVFSWKATYGADIWFQARYDPASLRILETSNREKAESLRKLIQACIELVPSFQQELFTWDVETDLEFSPNWGFGSSSTLIALMAEWAEINPLELHYMISEGSGFDVACAVAEQPILYWLREDEPHYQHVPFYPPFADQLYFVWLGTKQDTREQLVQVAQKIQPGYEEIRKFSHLSQQMIEATELSAFQALMEEHEDRLAALIQMEKVSRRRFPDLPGRVKSLGAWGGDFVLIAADADTDADRLFHYLKGKGFTTLFRFKDLVYHDGSPQ